MATPPFQLYGPAHLGVLAAVISALAAGIWLARSQRSPRATLWFERALAAGLAATYPAKLAVQLAYGSSWDYPLPCHVCDLAAFAGFFAIVLRSPALAGLVYFWGVAGTLQGLVTPAVQAGFPHPEFWRFFLLHGTVVTAAIYLPFGARLVPDTGAYWRAWLWSQAYLAGAFLTNALTGANYGFLREPPPNASLIDLLGPWPWYLVALEALALALYRLLDLPLQPMRKKE